MIRAAAYVAFHELENNLLQTSSQIPASVKAQLAELPAKSPLFVTWTKKGQLRGCIGTFAKLSLPSGIKKYALIAALQDTRFSPIRKSELPRLEVAITLLGELEECKDELDWELGTHGVDAMFADGTSATFLPEVPVEQGWTKQETLDALAQKAGATTSQFTLYRYEGKKDSLTYDEYKAYEESV